MFKGSRIRIASWKLQFKRQLWFRYPRTHRFGYQVWPGHRYLRYGFLRCLGPPRHERETQETQNGPRWIPSQTHQGWRYEMVPNQVWWYHLEFQEINNFKMFILNYLIKECLKFLSIGGVIVFEKKSWNRIGLWAFMIVKLTWLRII